jgi:hypothetical protein
MVLGAFKVSSFQKNDLGFENGKKIYTNKYIQININNFLC